MKCWMVTRLGSSNHHHYFFYNNITEVDWTDVWCFFAGCGSLRRTLIGFCRLLILTATSLNPLREQASSYNRKPHTRTCITPISTCSGPFSWQFCYTNISYMNEINCTVVLHQHVWILQMSIIINALLLDNFRPISSIPSVFISAETFL